MKDFLTYYQDELLFIRNKSKGFAKKHPQIAGKLDISEGESTDPHTERIIESFSFLTAKLNKKIDSTENAIAFYLLSALYPNLISPFPSCSIVEFYNKENLNVSDVIIIPKGTRLFIKSEQGYSYTFKTIYNVSLYPIEINSKLFSSNKKKGGKDGWYLEIGIKTNSVPIEKMNVSEMLFHINSDILDDALIVYESIFSDCSRPVFLKIQDSLIRINKKDFESCGFSDNESVCPVQSYSNNSFQLFQEMLHFKQKFMFFKIKNLNKYINESLTKNISDMSIIIDINFNNDRLKNIDLNKMIMINAVPVVNLFNLTTDPFRLTNNKSKYLLLPDQLQENSIEIHSISNVHMIDDETKEENIVQPYFSLEIDSDTNITHDLYWTYSKETSNIQGQNKEDFYISFVDKNLNPNDTYTDVIYAETLCMNNFDVREVPMFSELDVDTKESGGYGARVIMKPSPKIPFMGEKTYLWGLISSLASTHISMACPENFLLTIRKLIEIFSNGNVQKVEELISNIVHIKINKIVRRFGSDAWRGFVKGISFDLFVKDSTDSFFKFFFCCILNQYLSANVSINSFVELKLISEKTGSLLGKWKPTSGKMDLL